MSELTQLTFQIGWIAMLLGGIVFFVMNRSVPASERHERGGLHALAGRYPGRYNPGFALLPVPRQFKTRGCHY